MVKYINGDRVQNKFYFFNGWLAEWSNAVVLISKFECIPQDAIKRDR